MVAFSTFSFRNMLKLGKSKPWPEAMKILTGGRKRFSTRPMKQYFKVLEEWLMDYREENGYSTKWTVSENPLKPEGAKKPQSYLES